MRYSSMKKQTITTAAEARQHAIDWQVWASEQDLSYLELSQWGSYFQELAERFPELKDEFAENGII